MKNKQLFIAIQIAMLSMEIGTVSAVFAQTTTPSDSTTTTLTDGTGTASTSDASTPPQNMREIAGRQDQPFTVMSTSKDLADLSDVPRGECVMVGEQGEILLSMTSDLRSHAKIIEVVMFDEVVKPAPTDVCKKTADGETLCDFERADHDEQPGIHDLEENTRATPSLLQRKKVVYSDGTSQIVYPTVLSPQTFIEEGLKLAGVEEIVFQANGTFKMTQNGIQYLVYPNFHPRIRTVEAPKSVASSLVQIDNRLIYTVAVNCSTWSTTEENGTTRQTRSPIRSSGDAHQVLDSDLIIEPISDACEEIGGETVCGDTNLSPDSAKTEMEIASTSDSEKQPATSEPCEDMDGQAGCEGSNVIITGDVAAGPLVPPAGCENIEREIVCEESDTDRGTIDTPSAKETVSFPYSPAVESTASTSILTNHSVSASLNARGHVFTQGITVESTGQIVEGKFTVPVENYGVISRSTFHPVKTTSEVSSSPLINYGSISQSTFKTTVENHGLISNSVLTAQGSIDGGMITGTLTNQGGTLANFEFVGIRLSGGLLKGKVTNNSKVGGIIQDIQLAPQAILKGGKVGGTIKAASDSVLQNVRLVANTHIQGGVLKGNIQGERHSPAQLTDVKFTPGTRLSYVTVIAPEGLPDDVVIGPGVTVLKTPSLDEKTIK